MRIILNVSLLLSSKPVPLSLHPFWQTVSSLCLSILTFYLFNLCIRREISPLSNCLIYLQLEDLDTLSIFLSLIANTNFLSNNWLVISIPFSFNLDPLLFLFFGGESFALTLNISKAFGRVWHKWLISKLSSFSISSSHCNLLLTSAPVILWLPLQRVTIFKIYKQCCSSEFCFTLLF